MDSTLLNKRAKFGAKIFQALLSNHILGVGSFFKPHPVEMNLNRILFLTNPTHPHEAVCKNYTDRTLEFCMETQTMLYPVKIAASFFTRYSYSAANMKTKCGGLCKVRLLQIPWGIFLSRIGKIW